MMGTDDVIYQLAQLAVWFFLYACVGWCYEVVYSLVKHKRFINRGFFYGPICPIYGAGALLAIVLVGRIPNPLLAFAVGGLAAGAMEFVTSWVLERVFHARWWDYSDWPLNIQGRVCLAGVATFGVMMLLVSHVIHPRIAQLTGTLPPVALVALAGVLLVVFLTDFVLSVLHVRGFVAQLAALQERLTMLAADASSKVGEVADEAALRAADLFDWVGEATGRARERVEEVRRGAAEVWADVRQATSVAELAESLRELSPHLGRYREAGRELDDPDFAPTTAREAWELVKDVMREKVEQASRSSRR